MEYIIFSFFIVSAFSSLKAVTAFPPFLLPFLHPAHQPAYLYLAPVFRFSSSSPSLTSHQAGPSCVMLARLDSIVYWGICKNLQESPHFPLYLPPNFLFPSSVSSAHCFFLCSFPLTHISTASYLQLYLLFNLFPVFSTIGSKSCLHLSPLLRFIITTTL